MKFVNLPNGLLVLAGALLSGYLLFFHVGNGAQAAEQTEASPPAATMMDEPGKPEYGQPGESHKRLEALAGRWDAQIKVWMDDKSSPKVSTGKADQQWILGGRFLQQQFQGEFFGKPFRGMGLVGYDQVKKKYTAMWVDTTMTSITTTFGTSDEVGKVFTFVGEHDDPTTGKPTKTRDVTRIVDSNKHTLEMYEVSTDGKERMVFEFTFTRVNAK